MNGDEYPEEWPGSAFCRSDGTLDIRGALEAINR